MTPTRTVDDLRAAMEDELAGLSAAPSLATRVAALQQRRQRRHRITTGVVLVAAATMIAVPVVTNLGDATGADVTGGGPPLPAGWSSSLPGLDLPEGDPLTVAYVRAGELFLDGRMVDLAEPMSDLAFLTVPDGIIYAPGEATVSSSTYAASLELIREDGSITVLDSGIIAGYSAVRGDDGSIFVVYGWMDNPHAEAGEVRVLELGSDQPARSIPVEHAVELVPLAGVNLMAADEVMVTSVRLNGGRERMLLNLTSGELTSAGPDSSELIGMSSGGLEIRLDQVEGCVVGLPPGGDPVWSVCDVERMAPTGLSPDGRFVATASGAYDAETGEERTSWPLQDLAADDAVDLVTLVPFWEDESTALFVLGPPLDEESVEPPAYVTVRCAVDGGCDRIPHPVDQVGQFVG